MKTLTVVLTLIAFAVVADEQEPIGSKTSWYSTTNDGRIIVHYHNDTSGSNWVMNSLVPGTFPLAYKDADSGIVFYVESDASHIAAINPEGKILWHQNFSEHAPTNPLFNITHPRIIYVCGPPEFISKTLNRKNLVDIGFEGKQGGAFDLKTGEFFYLGHN